MTTRTAAPRSPRSARPAGAAQGEYAVEGRQPPLDAAQAGALARIGPALAVVADVDPQHATLVPHVDPDVAGPGVLGHVGQQLTDREVRRADYDRRRRLYRAVRWSPGSSARCPWPARGPPRRCRGRRAPAGELAHQVAQFGGGPCPRRVAGLQQPAPRGGRVVVDHLARAALSVMPIARPAAPPCAPSCRSTLDPADHGGAEVHHLGAALRQVRHLLLQRRTCLVGASIDRRPPGRTQRRKYGEQPSPQAGSRWTASLERHFASAARFRASWVDRWMNAYQLLAP